MTLHLPSEKPQQQYNLIVLSGNFMDLHLLNNCQAQGDFNGWWFEDSEGDRFNDGEVFAWLTEEEFYNEARRWYNDVVNAPTVVASEA